MFGFAELFYLIVALLFVGASTMCVRWANGIRIADFQRVLRVLAVLCALGALVCAYLAFC